MERIPKVKTPSEFETEMRANRTREKRSQKEFDERLDVERCAELVRKFNEYGTHVWISSDTSRAELKCVVDRIEAAGHRHVDTCEMVDEWGSSDGVSYVFTPRRTTPWLSRLFGGG